jgi:hypothetical protein
MAEKRSKHSLDAKTGRLAARAVTDLAGMIRSLLTIEGVDGIGQPVTLLSPADLPMEFLGFVERLRGGCIEPDEEMLLITLSGNRSRPRKNDGVLERLREALMVLANYAIDKGVPADAVSALLDEAKRKLSPKPRRQKNRE